MKLVYKLQSEEYKYEIPVNYLPVRTFIIQTQSVVLNFSVFFRITLKPFKVCLI